MKLSQSLQQLAKNVLTNLAEMGLDEAGRFICGARWPFFKKVLGPVLSELSKHFPDLFLDAEIADKAVDEFKSSPELQQLLENEYQTHFINLEEGQKEVLAVLLQQGETLSSIKEISETSYKKMNEIGLDVKDALALLREEHEESAISSDDIPLEVDALQRDAMQWIEKKRLLSAQRRLDDARRLIKKATENTPMNTRLLALRGYLEKTQAQVYFSQEDIDLARDALDIAANYFIAAHKADEKDASSLNGLANIYFYVQDYDTAVRFSKLALEQEPEYAEAAWDLALALEMKLQRRDDEDIILPTLLPVYEMLAKLIPHKAGFTASQLNYVQQRPKVLCDWYSSLGKDVDTLLATGSSSYSKTSAPCSPGRGKLWDNGAGLKIAFLNGEPELQEKVRTIAVEWTKYANIAFDFTMDIYSAEIRVSFDPGQGSFSYVGSDALSQPAPEATMNIEPEQSESSLRAAILVNFGHVLGLMNEEQNPAADIPWNKQAVLDEFMAAPYYWERGRIEYMLQKWPKDTFPFEKAYDPESIMHSEIPTRRTIGDFSTPQATDLSKGDKQWIAQLYPKD